MGVDIGKHSLNCVFHTCALSCKVYLKKEKKFVKILNKGVLQSGGNLKGHLSLA